MNDTTKKLLEPLSVDQPCGPDLSNDPTYDELTTLAKGKPEVEIGTMHKPAEPPDWRELRGKCAEYLGRSKHIGVATMYVCCLVKMDGLTGFSEGLQLIQGLLEQHWANLHPKLDPEDNNDPTQRINILGTLTASRGQLGTWIRIIDYLYAAEVCRPKGMPPITFEQLLAVRDKQPGAPGASKFTAALSEAGGEVIAGCQKTLHEAMESTKLIDQYLTTTLGAENTISFETLAKSLQELNSLLGPDSGEGGGAAGGADAATGSGGGTASSVRGAIKTREDVVRAIDVICEYYRQVEPGSPVPYVLRRAQKMVRMNFVETMQELGLATVDSLRPSMGTAAEPPAPPASPAAES